MRKTYDKKKKKEKCVYHMIHHYLLWEVIFTQYILSSLGCDLVLSTTAKKNGDLGHLPHSSADLYEFLSWTPKYHRARLNDWQLHWHLEWKWKSQLCLTLCDLLDYTHHRILQARILEWVAFPFSRRSSQPRDRTQVSCIAGGFFTSWATREAQEYWSR